MTQYVENCLFFKENKSKNISLLQRFLTSLLVLNSPFFILKNKVFYMKLKYALVFALLFSIAFSSCKSSKSSTDKRIKKQEKHRRKHPCPQIDC